MDWNLVIERNLGALRRILAALVAMAGGGAPTLPRIVHRAVLRLLRPAEAAARRLIIVVARDMVASPPRPRPARPKPAPLILRHGIGTGIVLPRGVAAGLRPAPKKPGRLSLALLDPLRRGGGPSRRFRGPGSSGVPRILFPGVTEPFPVQPWHPPSPDDPIDVVRLTLRLEALGRALDDLPAHALRFARWRARRDAMLAGERRPPRPGRPQRMTPFRSGKPPGICRPGARRAHGEVDAVLGDLHYFARRALASPDTS